MMRLALTTVLVFSSFILSQCAHKEVTTSDGQLAGLNYHEYHRLYFAGQPTAESLKAAKAEGISVVINLRPASEMKTVNFDEAKASKELGLTYVNIPMDGSKPLSKDKMNEIETAVMTYHTDHRVLVHCSSGNRAAAWFATHVAGHHKDNPEKAITLAKQNGLSKQAMIEKVRTYLSK